MGESDDRRAAVANAAGLSEVHGGTSVRAISYRAECDQEQGLLLTVSRIWDTKDSGDPPVDMFLVCPVCGEEHTLRRTS